MYHSFDTEIAAKYGIEEAIFLNYFVFWLTKNKSNKAHAHDGRYWTYNTMQAFTEQFPYMTINQVRRTLEKLKKDGLIVDGFYNAKPFDRTKWYSLSDEAMAMLGVDFHTDGAGENDNSECEDEHFQKADLPDTNGENDRPIPFNIPVNYTVNNSLSSSSSYSIPPNGKKDDKDDDGWRNICNLWNSNISPLLPLLGEKLKALFDEVGYAALEQAITKAVERGARNFGYVQTVARSIASGNSKPKKQQGGFKPPDDQTDLDDLF